MLHQAASSIPSASAQFLLAINIAINQGSPGISGTAYICHDAKDLSQSKKVSLLGISSNVRGPSTRNITAEKPVHGRDNRRACLNAFWCRFAELAVDWVHIARKSS